MKDLNELQIFAAIAQKMSFTRAAEGLGISKAAVSRALVSLEARLGARLFERTSRQLALTEAGEIYLRHATSAMEHAEQAEAAVASLNEQPRGTLRVVMPVTLARTFVAPRLAAFLREYPDLRIEIVLRGGQIDPIAHRVDVAFQTARPETDAQTIQKRLVTLPLGIYASPEYLAQAGVLEAPADLQQHSCLMIATGHQGATWVLHKDSSVQEVRLRGRATVGDPGILAQLCKDGAGVAILPEWIVRENVEKRYLVRVLREWTPAPIELYMLYPTRLSVTPKLRVFLKFMETAGGGAESYASSGNISELR